MDYGMRNGLPIAVTIGFGAFISMAGAADFADTGKFNFTLKSGVKVELSFFQSSEAFARKRGNEIGNQDWQLFCQKNKLCNGGDNATMHITYSGDPSLMREYCLAIVFSPAPGTGIYS